MLANAESQLRPCNFFRLLDGLADLGRWLDEQDGPKLQQPEGPPAGQSEPISPDETPKPRRTLSIGSIEDVRALALGDGAKLRKRGRSRRGKREVASPN